LLAVSIGFFKAMDYGVQSTLGEDDKKAISTWIKSTLDEMEVENDDVFVQYILVMISSGKPMGEISAELEAFLGTPECNNFVESLGNMLQPLDTAAAAATKSTPESSNSPKNDPLGGSLGAGRGKKGAAAGRSAMDAALSSGRQGGPPAGGAAERPKPAERMKSRLLQSALKPVAQPQQGAGFQTNKRRLENNNDAPRAGFQTNKRNRSGDDRQQQQQQRQQGGRPAPAPASASAFASAAASPANGGPMSGPMTGMMDPAAMAQQMDACAHAMGYESSAAMMQFYNMSMMSMMQGGGGQWAPPQGAGRGHEGGRGYRGRCVSRLSRADLFSL
jgi:hypothetical protein